ncbi:MAG TPA: saccharopine dehydrogenase NADP-binding domain-containing protein [Verrucomicrobiae bacterium]|nr:saccharopine dehydrogenase NADP-binding domain-containing protein [Verrucomicrobiae bacterium]
MRKQPPNVLVVGASGNVARAFLRRLGGQRCHFGKLVLLDKNRRVLQDAHLEHQRLGYSFVHHRLALPKDERFFSRLLKRHRINIVLDVSTHDTLPMLAAVDAAGASYVNTSLNDSRLEVAPLVERLNPKRIKRTRAPHALCAGMNPGVVNLWVHHGLAHFGTPRQIIHFEYDSSMTVDGWRPIVTWSKHEFLAETTWNRTGRYVGDGIELKSTNALQNRVPLRPLLRPILAADHCPKGFLVLHEENLTLGRALSVPSKFIYALHPRTMRYLVDRFRRKGNLREGDLEIGDNITRRLGGADMVGVCLEYPRRRVYYLNRMNNDGLIGTNATCAQVAVGIYAALFTLLYDRLEPRIHFIGDMYDTLYRRLVFANMRVEMFVCGRRNGRWVLSEHVPEVRLRSSRDRDLPAI